MILQPCDHCQGEGRLYREYFPRWAIEPREIDEGECPTCEGTGEVEVEAYPVEEDDDEFFAPGMEVQA